MRFEDEIDIRRPPATSGGSGVWQLVAVVFMLAAGTLLVISLALGAVLYVEHRKPNFPSAPVAKSSPAPILRPAPADNEDAEPADPPYPLVADLRPAGLVLPPGEERRPPGQTAHARFLALGKELWSAPERTFPQSVSISPDGRSIAYLQGQALMVGPLPAGPIQPVGGGAPPQPGALRGPGFVPPSGQAGGLRVVGRPAWSDDNRTVYFSTADGRLELYDSSSRMTRVLALHGDSPVPVPRHPTELICRRSRAVPKADVPSSPATADPAEIVLGDLGTGGTRVLVPESNEAVVPLAVSPDGTQLALALGPGSEGGQPHRQRLALLDVAAGGKPRAIGPPSLTLGPLCWAADGRALLYARQQQPLPPDCWEEDVAPYWASWDLFHLDLATGKETRLSRGGGFNVFSPTTGSDLFFVLEFGAGQADGPRLWSVPLAAALQFAAQEPNRPPRDQAAWSKLMHGVLEQCGLTAGAGGQQLTPDMLAKLADGFVRGHREHFQTDPPADAEGWERLQRELQTLSLSGSARPEFTVVLGAAEGEYLRRRHGAVWHLAPGPLGRPPEPATAPGDEESPFGLVLNPFLSVHSQSLAADDDDEDAVSGLWMVNALVRANGRALVLANTPTAGKEGLRALADPRLAHATELFEQNKAEEAEGVLTEMVQDKKHQQNAYLVLTVGKLLHDHGRTAALRKLLEGRVDGLPQEPRKYNLLGLALLERDPREAARQFQNALRCDLYYGPAYLNLAQAYEKAGDAQGAAHCLRRLLRLIPGGPLAGDARRRLAALQAAPVVPQGVPRPGGR
jgi:hypothetical protein